MLQFSFRSSAIKLKLCMCSSTYILCTYYIQGESVGFFPISSQGVRNFTSCRRRHCRRRSRRAAATAVAVDTAACCNHCRHFCRRCRRCAAAIFTATTAPPLLPPLPPRCRFAAAMPPRCRRPAAAACRKFLLFTTIQADRHYSRILCGR